MKAQSKSSLVRALSLLNLFLHGCQGQITTPPTYLGYVFPLISSLPLNPTLTAGVSTFHVFEPSKSLSSSLFTIIIIISH